MNPTKKTLSNSVDPKVIQNSSQVKKQHLAVENISTKELTYGQRLADKLAAQVGSWGFLIGQSAILAGWVGLNAMPGIPHWDNSPFMMLNLVFSFASAYTAPIVLMSQNRQSDTDRRNADIDHQVNLKAGQNIELLHEKLDELHTQRLNELTQIIKEQQQSLNELKVTLVPQSKEVKLHILPGRHAQINSKFSKQASSYKLISVNKQIDNNNKTDEN
ncbi:MAG: DUF1003 domain-containing protein [Brasilonema angustatum HA4187-MV1]|nr:DUF1003 domain-containing protein [Brasilonema angustatum HA4187-MV1]